MAKLIQKGNGEVIIQPQGTRANFTGNQLEAVIAFSLDRKGYKFVKKDKFEAACFLDQPIYSVQYPIANGVYNTRLFCDFIIYHPQKYPDKLVIESKWQQSNGSVDEKFPYLVLNIKEKYPSATIVVLDGGGYKLGAEKWLRDQTDAKLTHVFNMMEFQKWANSNDL